MGKGSQEWASRVGVQGGEGSEDAKEAGGGLRVPARVQSSWDLKQEAVRSQERDLIQAGVRWKHFSGGLGWLRYRMSWSQASSGQRLMRSPKGGVLVWRLAQRLSPRCSDSSLLRKDGLPWVLWLGVSGTHPTASFAFSSSLHPPLSGPRNQRIQRAGVFRGHSQNLPGPALHPCREETRHCSTWPLPSRAQGCTSASSWLISLPFSLCGPYSHLFFHCPPWNHL